MFGGQDDNAAMPPAGGGTANDTLNGVNDLAGGPAPAQPVVNGMQDGGGFMSTPSEPAQVAVPAPNEEAEDVVSPTQAPASAPASVPATDGLADGDNLLDLKQQALQQLTPLVGHLDQSPEDKFRTTMMLIQASDNQNLLKEAYEAAQAISDDKVRAQALLDVINEINYFTQSKQQG